MVLTAMGFQITLLLDVSPCSFAIRYRHKKPKVVAFKKTVILNLHMRIIK